MVLPELPKKGSKAKLLEAARAASYELVPAVHKFRVMQGDKIIGQFSNSELAHKTAREYPDAAVLDVSVKLHRVVPKAEGKQRKIGGWTKPSALSSKAGRCYSCEELIQAPPLRSPLSDDSQAVSDIRIDSCPLLDSPDGVRFRESPLPARVNG